MLGVAVELADDLFRVSAMSAKDMQAYCDYMESRDVTGIVPIDDKKTWADFYFADYLMGPTLTCFWLEMDRNIRRVYVFDL